MDSLEHKWDTFNCIKNCNENNLFDNIKLCNIQFLKLILTNSCKSTQ